MTTKPKARKFRIKRTLTEEPAPQAAVARPVPGPKAVEMPEPEPGAMPPRLSARERAAKRREQGAQDDAAPNKDQAKPDRPAKPAEDKPAAKAEKPAAPGNDATDIETIKREGLTGRQLRMARRVAQKHKLPATSDFEAVRLLREKGIDPFAASNTLELVVPKGGAAQHEGGAPDAFDNVPAERKQPGRELPRTSTPPPPPSTEMSPAERREREITQIQRDIMRRRRRKLMLLMTRLAFFVMLPTAIAGYYFYVVATPMYATKSEFLILQADNLGGSGLGGLLTGTQFATSQDSIATQSYLQSKDAMLRLDQDVGFKSHFSQDWIDPIQRLTDDPTNEEAYAVYKKNVQIGYDPTEGIIRMEVIAADPEIARDYSDHLISYAEQRINNLSQQKRADQMRDAMQGFEVAQAERRNAQEALVQLQQRGAILDPEGVIAGLRSQINNMEIQLQEKELQLAALMDNERPNQARVDGVQGDIDRIQNLLDDLNEKMVDASKGENSLAQMSVRIQMAQADLATRDLMLQSALQQVEQTRMEANRQVRYLTTSVLPVASQEASYPRRFENTILAFLVFSGIYLMFSLTASILREQVTS
ncbi:capsule biosynthesis protein [Phaeobacter sp. 22II1-1F12B]|uniref:capsule biosynthesis protein n=1 Tax=Phaeobacter sp. 22II1-1F12B TaxID=1317111 RepID=UPI000B529241|nr:capsule biosynthesis protein [Phaeobacter sp. 22II1-1F12B]OWU76281.1 capsule biosynthesis protein [Phaeobacter sp. 22II1-1F12B]